LIKIDSKVILVKAMLTSSGATYS